jgi:hypothetical protein
LGPWCCFALSASFRCEFSGTDASWLYSASCIRSISNLGQANALLIRVIMWCHRRRAARHIASGNRNLTVPMQEPSVERWLAEQNVADDPEQYAQDSWYVSTHSVSSKSLPQYGPGTYSWPMWLDDVMRGMPRSRPWVLLPYQETHCFTFAPRISISCPSLP